MTEPAKTYDRLLDLAESRIRHRGFHAVSFRELADELGIKSASVHYYFPQKQDLGVAVVERYGERFFEALNGQAGAAQTADANLDAMISTYRAALRGSDRICLCGILGAESSGLPDEVSTTVRKFLDKNIEWLAARLPSSMSETARRSRATQIVSTLQGAMMMATSFRDHRVFDKAVSSLSAGS